MRYRPEKMPTEKTGTNYLKIINWLYKLSEDKDAWEINKWDLRKKDLEQLTSIMKNINTVASSNFGLLKNYYDAIRLRVNEINLGVKKYSVIDNKIENLIGEKEEMRLDLEEAKRICKDAEREAELAWDKYYTTDNFKPWAPFLGAVGFLIQVKSDNDLKKDYERKKIEAGEKEAEYEAMEDEISHIDDKIWELRDKKSQRIGEYDNIITNLRDILHEFCELYRTLIKR